MVDTTNEWIISRTGIENRHITNEGEATSDMGAKIADELLKKSGKSAKEIDLILVSTSTPDVNVVSTASIIQDKTLTKIKNNPNITCINNECKSKIITYIKYNSNNMDYLYICATCGEKWTNKHI